MTNEFNKLKNNKKSYEYYKARGICVRCKREKAADGRVQCQDCLDKRTEYSSQRHATGKSTYDKVKKSEYTKRKKQLCDTFGVCTTCMKHDKYKGKQCINCYLKRRREYREKVIASGKIPKDMWRELDLCTTCGEPVAPGHKVCEKHLKVYQQNIKKAHESIDYSNHKWKKNQQAEVLRIQSYRRAMCND